MRALSRLAKQIASLLTSPPFFSSSYFSFFLNTSGNSCLMALRPRLWHLKNLKITNFEKYSQQQSKAAGRKDATCFALFALSAVFCVCATWHECYSLPRPHTHTLVGCPALEVQMCSVIKSVCVCVPVCVYRCTAIENKNDKKPKQKR